MKKLTAFVLAFAIIFCLSVIPSSVSASGADVSLRYDDRYTFTGYTVTSVGNGVPTSYQVGYSIAENSVKDTAVLKIKSGDNSTVIATGIGTTTVTLSDGTNTITKTVSVEAAPISVFLIIGQSNAEGTSADDEAVTYDKSIICPEGQVYSTFSGNAWGIAGYSGTTFNVSTAGDCAPDAINTTNIRSSTGGYLSYPINALTASENGKGGMDSGFAYEWVKRTGEKIWHVNSASGGTAISQWQPSGTDNKFWRAVELMKYVMATMKKEVNAGHYTLKHFGYTWLQGESDSSTATASYAQSMRNLHKGLKDNLNFDFNNDGTKEVSLEFGGIQAVRTNTWPFWANTTIGMNGPRTAQYYLAACKDEDVADLFMISNASDSWVDPNQNETGDGVRNYYAKYYPNGIDYVTQDGVQLVTPTTSKEMKKECNHYYQVAYNEIGRDTARNLSYILGYSTYEFTDATNIKLLKSDGYTEYNASVSATIGQVLKIVPVAFPLYKAAEGFDIKLSNGLGSYVNGELTVAGGGTITFELKDGTSKTLAINAPTPTTVATTTIPVTTTVETTGVNIKYGDVNDDGYINSKDSLTLKKFLADWDITINLQAADVNCDHGLTSKDSLLLKQFLAEWPVKLGN